jgi:hypothetical protein
MGYLKSTLAGVAGATATGLSALAYQSFHSEGGDVHVTHFCFPRWIPHWTVDKGMDFCFAIYSNAPLLLIVTALVIGFSWEYYRCSSKADTPRQ